jgi:hypothetical protein
MAGDLGAALRALEADQAAALMPSAERAADLAWASVTDAIAEVRAHLEAEPATRGPSALATSQVAAGLMSP